MTIAKDLVPIIRQALENSGRAARRMSPDPDEMPHIELACIVGTALDAFMLTIADHDDQTTIADVIAAVRLSGSAQEHRGETLQ